MNEPITLRRATLDDLPVIVRIYNQSIPERNATCDLEPATLEERLPWFHAHGDDYPLWVADRADRVAGWACISHYSEKAGYQSTVENSVYVDRAARGRGVGRLLLEHTVNESRRLGFHAIVARVFAHNPASLALHRGLGFTDMAYLKEIARLDGIYRDVVFLVRLFDSP